MIYTEYAVSKLQELLDQVSSMPQVPDLHTSAQSDAAFEEWQQQWDKFNDLEHDAKIVALLTVPTEVREMLDKVKAKVQEKQRLGNLSNRSQSSL